jgi:hypothetical protein
MHLMVNMLRTEPLCLPDRNSNFNQKFNASCDRISCKIAYFFYLCWCYINIILFSSYHFNTSKILSRFCIVRTVYFQNLNGTNALFWCNHLLISLQLQHIALFIYFVNCVCTTLNKNENIAMLFSKYTCDASYFNLYFALVYFIYQ